MDIQPINGIFENISQRVVNSYLRSMAELSIVLPDGMELSMPGDLATAEKDLHRFFLAFYSALFADPESFGLPITQDACITGGEKDPVQYKQEVTRKIKKPRDLLAQGVDFLFLAGQKAHQGGASLNLNRDDYAAVLRESKIKKPFLKGFAEVGLSIEENDTEVILTNHRFPAMMPALRLLAAACARREEKNLGRFLFYRCDLRALDLQYRPGALELYRVFHPADFERVAQVHTFFTELQYKLAITIYPNPGWEVQYQGKRQIKSSPLLRIEFSDRYQNPLQVDIKCASTDRLIPRISAQPRFLQEDFSRRLNPCRGDECGWCSSRKNLGPSVFEHDGEQSSVCWYTNPDIQDFNDESVRLVKQYAVLHEELA